MEDEGFYKVLSEFPGLVTQHRAELRSTSTPVTANLVDPPQLPPLPSIGLGTADTIAHLQRTILPNLAQGHAGPRYYGTLVISLAYERFCNGRSDTGFLASGLYGLDI
jgi:hypothetical protein